MIDRIGPYTLIGELGRGGMGVVYLADDTRLGRRVAIKALPEELAQDSDRLGRFEREARVLAQLSHPGVAGIYGVEEQNGARYLVLEYVEGETLADLLDRGPLPTKEAIALGIRIAEAIEAAHEAGITHRDLKPANIMLTDDGGVKVLDFGLARTEEGNESSSGSNSQHPTLTSPVGVTPTSPGVVLGTAAYMSPEQARGRRVDKRTDIWSFGVVLYEMLTGAGPFVGETITDSIGAILHKDADPAALPSDAPPGLRRILDRCMERDCKQRFRDIGDVRIELEQLGTTQEADNKRGTSPIGLLAIAAALVLLAAAVLIGMPRQPAPEPRPAATFDIINTEEGRAGDARPERLVLSADGSMLAFGLNDDTVYVRDMSGTAIRKLELPWPAWPLTWSADTRWLVVRSLSAENALWRVDPRGGDPRLICELPEEGFLWQSSGVQLIDDETLCISMASAGLYTVPISGGTAQLFLPPETNETLVTPSPITGTDAIVFLEADTGSIQLYNRGLRRNLLTLGPGSTGRVVYSPTGHLIIKTYQSGRTPGIWAVPFDNSSLEITGEPFRIAGEGVFAIDARGTFVFSDLPYVDREQRALVWVSPTGERIGSLGEPLLDAWSPEISPDGMRIVVCGTNEDNGDVSGQNLLVIDRSSGSRYEIPDSVGREASPSWTKDGSRIVFTTWAAGIRHARIRDASGRGEAELLTEDCVHAQLLPGGTSLVGAYDGIFVLDLESGARSVIRPNRYVYSMDTHPNGGFVAFCAAGAQGIRVAALPDGSAETIATEDRARAIRWTPEGDAIIYWSNGVLKRVDVDVSGVQPIIGSTTTLFTAEQAGVASGSDFDIDDDGSFLMVEALESDGGIDRSTGIIRVTQDWAAQFGN